ncbi:hypothetical protein V8E53_001792 [Lactarius tabidus]
MAGYAPPQVPPHINRIVAEVAHTLKKDRHLGGLWRNWTSEKIRERGEAYLDGSRILIDECHPWMPPIDKDDVITKYKLARDAMASLDNSSASGIGIQKVKKARKARTLCKNTYLAAKKASDRGLDHNVLGPLSGANPPAGPSPATPEESADGTDPLAGESPGTPEEPDIPSLHDPFTDSHAATSSIDESIDIETTLPSGAAGIGVLVDDASESYSFFYDPDLAASGTSIASYKTERTVNSRKSRYNVLPRHKYADHGYLRPQDPGSSGVDDASVPKTEIRDESDESPPSSPCSAPPSSPGPSPGTQPSDGPSTAPPNTEHVHDDAPSQPPSPH